MTLAETHKSSTADRAVKSLVFVDGASGTTGLGINERLQLQSDVVVKAIAEDKRKDPARQARADAGGGSRDPLPAG